MKRLQHAAVILLVGSATTIAFCYALGLLAKAAQHMVDAPLFRLVRAHQDARWTRVLNVVTLIGDRPPVKAVAVIAVVALTVLWRRREWWLPALMIGLSFVLEKYVQQLLQSMVARGHPPTFDGTYPSGGCGRVLAVYGIIGYLLVVHLNRRDTRPETVTWWLVLLALAALTEGLTRIYLLRHWVTDVIGGWLMGMLLLVVLIAVADALQSKPATAAAWRSRSRSPHNDSCRRT